MSPVIRKHNGFIDKYMGDAIMALFPGHPPGWGECRHWYAEGVVRV